MILSFSGCTLKNHDDDDDKSTEQNLSEYEATKPEENATITDSKQINNADIEYASPYSEGLMFIKTSTDDSRVYCVDKNGYVAFELTNDIINVKNMDEAKFMGGYAFVRAFNESGNFCDAICDKQGNITLPSDIGATDFFGPDEILKSGYILATKVGATTSKLGVLNTSFEWVVPLSEDLYNEFSDSLSDSHKENFVIDEYFYSVKLAKSLNLKTGRIDSVKLKDVTPSNNWGTPKSCDGYYRIENSTIVAKDGQYIDLDDNVIRASNFSNGTAPILYENESEYFVTLINEKGTHLFEPVQITYAPNSFKFATDGNYLVYTEKSLLVCRDVTGKKIAEFDLEKFDDKYLSINNGVIVVSNFKNALCFDAQLNKLF